MRHSTKQTTVAVLRSIIGVKADEMARILRCSIATINSLEVKGRLKLSEEMAVRIMSETGISLAWLLGGDPSSPAVTEEGGPFTPETFDRVQAGKAFSSNLESWGFSIRFIKFVFRMRASLAAVKRAKDLALMEYRVTKFLDALMVECGVDFRFQEMPIQLLELEQDIAEWKELDKAAGMMVRGTLAPHEAKKKLERRVERFGSSENKSKKPSRQSSARPRRKA